MQKQIFRYANRRVNNDYPNSKADTDAKSLLGNKIFKKSEANEIYMQLIFGTTQYKSTP